MSDFILEPEVVREKTMTGYAYSDFMDIKLFTEQFQEQKQKSTQEKKQAESETESALFTGALEETTTENMTEALFLETGTQTALAEQQMEKTEKSSIWDITIAVAFILVTACFIMRKHFGRQGREKKRRRPA